VQSVYPALSALYLSWFFTQGGALGYYIAPLQGFSDRLYLDKRLFN